MLIFILTGCSQALPSQMPPETQDAVKTASTDWLIDITTTAPGFYRVEAAALREAGVSAEQTGAEQIFLYNRGVQQPLWRLGAGRNAGIIFYAASANSLYTDRSIYRLSGSPLTNDLALPGEAISSTVAVTGQQPEIELPAGAYAASLLAEQNLLYLPQVETGDHWFWENLPAPQLQEFSLTLNGVMPGGTALLRVQVWSSTDAPSDPDHHLVMTVNDEPAVDETWDGNGWHNLEARIDSALLKDGENIVTLQAPGDLGVAAEINYIDHIQLIHPRLPQADKDVLQFVQPQGELKLKGFSGQVDLFDVTDPERVELLETGVDTEKQFQGEPGHTYAAVGEGGYLAPLSVSSLVFEPDLRRLTPGADYIAIGPPDLLQELAPLLDLRSSQGLRTLAVPLQAIYAQFNHGYPEPQAINQFMRYAATNWDTRPRYLLLVGDATYDPRGYLAPVEANRLPTYLVNTVFGGQTASDVEFVQLNDDPWPDLPVGRVPARAPQQVKIFVDKTLAFEKTLSADAAGLGTAGRQVLAVADGQDVAFQADAQAFLDLFPETYPVELFAPAAGVAGANLQIKTLLEGGDFLVAYFGHGSINMWGKDRLFTVQDVQTLAAQPRLPILINMTCLTGLYTHPKIESLAEAFLWQPDGGAVAVLAPSSLTLPTDQTFLSHPFVEAMLKDPQARLGDLHLTARRQVPVDNDTSRDVMLTFMLFGDPALRLSP